jgi:phage shock protein PspC (stress-responsive transcriptional regulator)
MQDSQTANDASPIRQLVRDRNDRWLGGVAGGLGRYFDVNPGIYRIAFAALALVGGTGIVLYIAAWLVMPDEGEADAVAERLLREYRDRPAVLIVAAALGLAATLLFAQSAYWPYPGNAWLAVILAGGGVVLWHLHREREREATTPRRDVADQSGAAAATGNPYAANAAAARASRRRRMRERSMFLPVMGLLVLGCGVLALIQLFDLASIDWRIALAVAAAIAGGAVVAGAVFGARIGGVLVIGVLLVAVLELTIALHIPLRGGIANEVMQPASAAELNSDYHLAIGALRLDLTELDLPAGTTHVDASVGIGHLVVLVPDDVRVEFEGHAGFGNLQAFGRNEGGLRLDRSFADGESGASANRTLVLDTRVGIGEVEVLRR